MPSKRFLTFAVGVTLATISLASTVALAQFPLPPPMAPAGPPPMPAAGLPTFAGPSGRGADLGGTAPHLGPATGPRPDLAATRRVGGAPAILNSTRAASVDIGHSGAYGHHVGGARYDYRAAHAAGAYAAGASAGYAYGRSRDGYYSGSDCQYIYRRHRRIPVCD